MTDSATSSPITIKKYANRRLYNTATSSYVTLENLSAMVKEGTEFNVYDAKTGEDLTRQVLTQIIVEEEGKSGQTGQNLLPIGFLRQLIGFYGDNMQWMVPKYLEQSMQSLTQNQGQMRSYMEKTMGSFFPFGTTLEQMSKQNMAMFEQTIKLFSPFAAQGKTGTTENKGSCGCSPKADTCEGSPTSAAVAAPTTQAAVSSAPSASSYQYSGTAFNLDKQPETSCGAACSINAPVTSELPTPNATEVKAEKAPVVVETSSLSDYRAPTAVPAAKRQPDPEPPEEMQQKISNLQKQLAELAKRRG